MSGAQYQRLHQQELSYPVGDDLGAWSQTEGSSDLTYPGQTDVQPPRVSSSQPPLQQQQNFSTVPLQQAPPQQIPQTTPGYVYPPQQQPPQQQGQQQQYVGGPVQQVQYTVQPNMLQQVPVVPRPNYSPPHTFLILTIIVMIVCSILNITSLMFGIPALVVAIFAHEHVSRGEYPQASTKGMIALILTMINAGYTILWGVAITGAIVGIFCTDYYDDYYCGSRYNRYYY